MTQSIEIRELQLQLAEEKRTSDELKIHLKNLEQRFDDYVNNQRELESRRLRTALIWAGGLILGLAGFLFNELVWPIIKSGKP